MIRHSLHAAADVSRRAAGWIRKDYPKAASATGHCYLVALCGTDPGVR